MSIMNGETAQSSSQSYILNPLDVGEYVIEPMSVTIEGKTYKTEEIEIVVLANPDGVKQVIPQEEIRSRLFFDKPFGESPRKKEVSKKPRRKSYKI